MAHIIFQYIQINCDFTLTMKLPWFLLNLVWLCMTNIQAVKLWLTVVWPCTMHLQKRKRASLHWRHSSMTSFFIVVHFTYEMAYLLPICAGFGEFDPLNVVGHRAVPKRHFLAWLRVIWVIVCENPPKDHISRRVRGKKIWCYISRICPDLPLGWRHTGSKTGAEFHVTQFLEKWVKGQAHNST